MKLKHIVVTATLAVALFGASSSYAQCASCNYSGYRVGYQQRYFRPLAWLFGVQNYNYAVQPSNACQNGQCEVEDGAVETTEYAAELTETENKLIAIANRVRRSCPIAHDANLQQWAASNSNTQAYYCQLGHFTGKGWEIAGAGYATPESAINGWLNSPPHRAILLNSSFTKVGASCKRGRDGRLYWTMTFGR